jgi:hypothetical protein
MEAAFLWDSDERCSVKLLVDGALSTVATGTRVDVLKFDTAVFRSRHAS